MCVCVQTSAVTWADGLKAALGEVLTEAPERQVCSSDDCGTMTLLGGSLMVH